MLHLAALQPFLNVKPHYEPHICKCIFYSENYGQLLSRSKKLFVVLSNNGLRLGEGGDFQHQTSNEALMFVCPQNCHTKHCTATFAKPQLPAGVLSSVKVRSGNGFAVIVVSVVRLRF